MVAWQKKRYIDFAEVPLVPFEMREVIDLLLRDVGVRHERHKVGMTG
jgi:hypothetical protein